jgi:hypothetical protein
VAAVLILLGKGSRGVAQQEESMESRSDVAGKAQDEQEWELRDEELDRTILVLLGSRSLRL